MDNKCQIKLMKKNILKTYNNYMTNNKIMNY